MKIYYKLILLISFIGLSRNVFNQPACGIDDPYFICVEGMTACSECNLSPSPGFPGSGTTIWIPEVTVNPNTGQSFNLIDYWPNFVPPVVGSPTTTSPSPLQLIVQQTKNTECDGVRRANELANNAAIRAAIAQIKDRSVEWGVAGTLSDPDVPNSINMGTPYTDNKTNSISFKPTWSAQEGYTLVFIHNHPSGSAPSPSDLFNAAINIKNVVDNGLMTESQLTNYLTNFASIIVSGDYVYTVTIKNALLFSLMAGEFDKAQAEATRQYKNALTTYFVDNGIGEPATTSEKQLGGESILIKMYDKMFNLSKQKITDANNNKIVKKDAQGNIIKTDPCTP
ncbi:hypothetical protein BWD42_07845 [Sphingobacterium sp. CZ-UAM]|uniref:hypothetical protein n=1 Tax=Sphingobacterium sp. CZ-UAM TaxID=1933868 RepID=UPI000986FA36|nr:hypothetical protein [Sphingobacterium sp. CZ-UAM]OOG19800.1 hypothetical protein BWD42_07845 [Sphingobacterium sp. CZ-UAM]